MLRICKQVDDGWQRGDCMDCPFGGISDIGSIVCYAGEDTGDCQIELFGPLQTKHYKKVPLDKEKK